MAQRTKHPVYRDKPAPSRSRIVLLGAILGTGALAAALLWIATARTGFAIQPDPDRNILIVTIDTLRADALGAYGGRAATANLDRLAAGGARFDFAHAHAVVTLPSHASIFTGLYPYDHGIRDNTGYRLATTHATAATLLKARGFATGAFTGGFPLDRRFGLNTGFDLYDDRLASAPEASDRERRADAVVEAAVEWIGAQQKKWFTWVHVYDPHTPYAAPKEWSARFPNDPYLGEVSWTDHALGPLFDRLRSSPHRTLVVVTADHGESLGDHGERTHGLFAYEAVLRVPLIVAELGGADARAPEGVTIDTPVQHVDVLPTLLESAGARLPQPLAGVSLLGLIENGSGAHRPAYFEAMTAAVTRGWAPLRGAIVGREKFIDLPLRELYDLSSDPAESRNLIVERRERAEVLDKALRDFSVAPPERAQRETAETVERLRSLGYIGGGTAQVKERYTENDDPKKLVELEQMMHRALDAQREGRAAEAAQIYGDVIRRRPDMEDAYRRLALLYWRAGRPADAIGTLETALRNGVTQPEVRNRLGQYLAEAGQPEKAIALLEGEASDDPDARLALANAYLLSGRYDRGLDVLRKLVESDPENAVAHQNIGAALLQKKDYAGAEASLRRAVSLDPGLAGAQTALGVVLANTERRAEAIEAWKRAIELDGAELNALYNLTVNLAQAGRMDEAREYGTRFLSMAPPSAREDSEAIRRILAAGM
jgi:arylsulfatase A-like enzyme/predicted negative regulator of RcsB-dependent stress response